MKAPPPIPEDCGSTRLSTICVAIAASIAVPPARSISSPAAAASGLAAATMCRRATTCSFLAKPVAGSGTVSARATAVAMRISVAARNNCRYAGQCVTRGTRSAVVAAIIFQVIVTQALKTGNKERIDQMSRRAIAEERSEWHSRAMLRPGKRNLITDVDGIRIGNAEDNKVWTGSPSSFPTRRPSPRSTCAAARREHARPTPSTRPAWSIGFMPLC